MEMIKLKLIFIYLSFTVILYPQITEVTRLPVQNPNQSIKESAPVWLSENEIMIFYINETKDTIFSTRSTNRGVSWSEAKFQFEVDSALASTDLNFPTAIKTNSGRIIFVWSDLNPAVIQKKIVVTYSDDNGQSWSDKTQFIEPSGAYNCRLSELENGKIILSWNDFFGRRVKYRESSDNGSNWSEDAITFYMGATPKKNISFFQVRYAKILAVIEYDSGIYYQVSTNGGITWSEEIPVVNTSLREHNPRVVQFSDVNIWITYQVNESPQSNFSFDDIYLIKGSDGGEVWGEPERFTNYAGDDNNLNAVKFEDKAFISFTTTRFNNKQQISYAILGETIENFRPPYIVSALAKSEDLNKKHWMITANVIDDEEVMSVNITFEDGSYAQLFDDGLHGDGDPNDSVFANVVLLNTIPPSESGRIDINKLLLPFNNVGMLANTRSSFTQNAVLEAIDNTNDLCQYKTQVEDVLSGPNSKGRFEEGNFLYSGGFVLSGFTNGQLWSNAAANSMLVHDYLEGKVGINPNDPLNKIYTVYSNDPVFGNSWQYWKDAVSMGAEFYDGDGDGIYNPVDRNWNGTWEHNEDMPMIIGDITAWCVYNDGRPANQRRWYNVDPQGIEVKQTVFAVDKPELENIIFIRYSIVNTGSVANLMDSVCFGFSNDGDLGYPYDDVVGCDTLLDAGYYYNNEYDNIYGDNCPAFFSTVLQGPVVNTNKSSDTAKIYLGEMFGSSIIEGSINLGMSAHSFFYSSQGNTSPQNAIEARNLLLGLSSDGQTLDPCTYAFGEVRGGVNCIEVNPVYWMSGDPVQDIGWICNQNRDLKNIVSTGPFLLEKDKPQEIIIAYVLGRGTDYFNSITVARENVQKAIAEYESNFASMTYSAPPATNPVNSYVLFQNYPNPFNPNTMIRYELPQDGQVTIDIFDILGQRVTTIVNEYKRADRYEVTFSSKGLASGVYIYQLRVNDFIQSKKMILLR